MKYPHKEKSSESSMLNKTQLEERAKIYLKSDSFDEYQIQCAVQGIHKIKIFDRFWWFYIQKNLGYLFFMIMFAIFSTLMAFSIACVIVISSSNGRELVVNELIFYIVASILMSFSLSLLTTSFISLYNSYTQEIYL